MSEEQNSCWHILMRFHAWSRERKHAKSQSMQRISRWRFVFWTVAFLLSTGIGVYLRAEIQHRTARFSSRSNGLITPKGGTLMIVGGGQLNSIIRDRFIELAGRAEARIVVIPAMAIELSEFAQYRDPWDTYHVKSVEVLHADSRTQADDPEFSKILESATGVWLAGGQQTWLAAWYGRTLVETRLHELLARDGVIGGTSAGAAVMSKVMIAGGRQKPLIGHGFDLIPNAIIDQHFLKRNRFQRLQNAVEQHPELIGFGIDEGTAMQYSVANGRFRVLGQSSVVACVPQVESDQRLRFRMEILNAGDEFDVERLRNGEPVPPGMIDLDSVLWGE